MMEIGKGVFIIGLVVAAIGGAIWIFPGLFSWLGSWFGRLPGDIRYEGDRSRVYVPIVSMVVVSLVISLLLNLWHRLSR